VKKALGTTSSDFRAYTMQDQYVRLEHVHIGEGSQAVIGNVRASEGGRAEAPETQKRHDPDETCPDPHNRKGELSDAN
jgi:hypothetical protein